MIVLVDNYDSFTYNLVQAFQILGKRVLVVRNDSVDLDFQPDYLVVGPGPGRPKDSGISKALMQLYLGRVPILGVCLGHQCIAELFGGTVGKALRPIHGKTAPITHSAKDLYEDIPQHFRVMRYNSLIVHEASLPSCLEISAKTSEGEIMGLQHREYVMHGVQYHPESIATEYGLKLLQNFLNLNNKG